MSSTITISEPHLRQNIAAARRILGETDLLAVIKAVKDEGPVRLILCDKCAALASEEIAKHGSFALGYMTKARVAAARIAEVPMP